MTEGAQVTEAGGKLVNLLGLIGEVMDSGF